MNAVFGAIFENMQNIEIIYEQTHTAFRKDRKNTADSREVTVEQFLSCFFPKSYTVKKGIIYGISSESKEIDCVVLAPNHPLLITPKREIIIAEGVHAAVEVKPDISTQTQKSEFYRSLTQIKSVKQIKRKLTELPFSQGKNCEYENLIPCGIFSNASRDIGEIYSFLLENVKEGNFLSHELPDIIVSLEKGILFHSMHIEKTFFSNVISSIGEKYLVINGKKDELLGMFLLVLLYVRPPEYHNFDFILKEYLWKALRNIEVYAIQ